MRLIRSRVVPPIAVFVPLLALACGSPSAPGGSQPHRALYAAALTLDDRVGTFEVRDGGRTTDVLSAGGLVEIVLDNDRTVVGRLHLPAGALFDEAVDVRLDGVWRVEEDRLRIAPREEAFLEDVGFEIRGSRLRAEATVRGRAVTIELVEVARADPTLRPPDFPALEASAELLGVPGRGIVARVSLLNRTGRDLAVLVGPCPAAFVRAYAEAPERLVWDQRESLGCRERRRLALVAAGRSFHVDTPLFNASHVAVPGAPAQRFGFRAVFPLGAGEVTAFAGSVLMFFT